VKVVISQNILHSSSTKVPDSVSFFLSVKLDTTSTEATYCTKDVNARELLGEQSAEMSGFHREDNLDSCEIYKNSFSCRNNPLGHTHVSIRETVFCSEKCVKLFNEKRSAMRRFRSHERPNIWNVCNESFNSPYDLGNHIRVHIGEQPFYCEVCKKSFAEHSNLNMHLRIYSGERAFSCNMCNRRFTQRSNLKAHFKIHTGERAFSFKVCKKRFAHRSNLNMHLIVHTGERPFSCELCKEIFSRRSTLTEHLRVHSGERPFACNICKNRFAQLSNLITHLKSHSHLIDPSEGKCSLTTEI
jgi:KRAB domain-containing zinc finger protein